MSTTKKDTRPLGLFSLVMITIVSVDSIRNLPATALFGTSLVSFFILAALFFLIPSALVSAELSSAWPKQGGVYVWVKEAFGERLGFVAIWLQWIENVIWYPTLLSFVASTLTYLLNPILATNKFYLASIIVVIFWGVTFINWFGIKLSAQFSTLCSIFGLIIPMSIIIVLGGFWLTTGHYMYIHFAWRDFLPPVHESQTWVALTGIILSCTGMEIATVHAGHVKHPKKVYPRAIFYSTLIIIATLIGGSLAIAMVLPMNKISLVAGIMQAFDAFFSAYHFHRLMPVIMVMLVIGGLGSVNNWIIAPVEGLLIAAKDTTLPKPFHYKNKYDAPSYLLIGQAVLVSLLAGVFLLEPTVNRSYWLLTALAAQLYMLMYILMFAACLYLRYKAPDKERPFSIGGKKNRAVWIWCSMGILASLLTLIVGFIPPASLHVIQPTIYSVSILAMLLILASPPLWLTRPKRSHATSKSI